MHLYAVILVKTIVIKTFNNWTATVTDDKHDLMVCYFWTSDKALISPTTTEHNLYYTDIHIIEYRQLNNTSNLINYMMCQFINLIHLKLITSIFKFTYIFLPERSFKVIIVLEKHCIDITKVALERSDFDSLLHK